MMANKNQILGGVISFLDNEMIPAAQGNHKIVLRGAKALVAMRFDNIFKKLKESSIVSMAGLVDEADNVDLDCAARVLQEALGADEFKFSFSLFGQTYEHYFTAEDIGKIKQHIERS